MIVDARSLQTLIHLKDRKEEISDIKFSPGNEFSQIFFENLSRGLKYFTVAAAVFYHVLSPFQAKRHTCSRDLSFWLS